MIYVGTSGYSFPDWKGSFYPEEISTQERLSFYAERFRTVELNFTYYALPKESTIARMTEVTPDDFKFFVKANKATTHQREREAAEPFLKALQPCREAGKLAGILAQFPNSFKNRQPPRQYLSALREDFDGYPLVVEFRDESWNREPVFDFLKRLGFGFCCVDEPNLKGLMPPVAQRTSSIGYVRFHSRDASKWYGGDASERYNYLYSDEELKEWVPKIREMDDDSEVEDIFVFFNNCHSGHAAVNAVQFEEMLREMGIL